MLFEGDNINMIQKSRRKTRFLLGIARDTSSASATPKSLSATAGNLVGDTQILVGIARGARDTSSASILLSIARYLVGDTQIFVGHGPQHRRRHPDLPRHRAHDTSSATPRSSSVSRATSSATAGNLVDDTKNILGIARYHARYLVSDANYILGLHGQYLIGADHNQNTPRR
ncbi:Os07g0462066 [Oryza sativa Japonica Group]|uniref:Os07g0462066 protein n=1 Tax=Oryza sativa subsp. japonica TaxID=39947 RepID=A0A0P0X5K7_ORYSJ|nr:Os07g0462066 [Oryza sativa Japonica Group]